MFNTRSIIYFIITLLLLFSPNILAVESSPAKIENSRKFKIEEKYRSGNRINGLKGLSNVGIVTSGIMRGDQPEAEGYKTLKEMGIRTVINLRYKHSEKEVVEKANMKSIEIPINTIGAVSKKTADKILKLLTDESLHPIYIHCHHGKDRTGAIMAIYRMKVDGWSYKKAKEEMYSYGFRKIWINLKKLVKSYSKPKVK